MKAESEVSGKRRKRGLKYGRESSGHKKFERDGYFYSIMDLGWEQMWAKDCRPDILESAYQNIYLVQEGLCEFGVLLLRQERACLMLALVR